MQFIRRLFGMRLSQPTLSGIWYAYLWMMIGALILSLLLQGEVLEEQELMLYTYFVHAISILFGGIISGKRAGTKGWFQGGITAILYVVTLLLISFLAFDTSLSLQDWMLIAPGTILGILGGIVGVNLAKK